MKDLSQEGDTHRRKAVEKGDSMDETADIAIKAVDWAIEEYVRAASRVGRQRDVHEGVLKHLRMTIRRDDLLLNQCIVDYKLQRGAEAPGHSEEKSLEVSPR
jgi:hypothetical protein